MLSVAIKPVMLSVMIVNVITLSVNMLSVIMLSVAVPYVRNPEKSHFDQIIKSNINFQFARKRFYMISFLSKLS